MSVPGEPSDGQQHLPLPVAMRVPYMDFVYRMSAEMADTTQPVGAPFNGKYARMIMPIKGGIVKGPNFSGEIVHMSGADWGTTVQGADFMRLDARYTVRTDDGIFVFIKSKGVFSGGAGNPPAIDSSKGPPTEMSQDQVEWFTRLQFEAPPGRYNWMNGVFAIGVLAMTEKKIIIDAYRITNFPHLPPRDMNAS
ncbi:hypothetical protein BDZ85DRAFT_267618 [Elsinoe ampelina]|uniref:Uncharacterized protein n=1 Tax=Elsinoe ampelina TaxID=302913 RepID=A0A6A6G3K9_9PEZI|nr:hypothetical protein BDZ85DRAFT_267618 [Elsinoe ampelina]